MASPDTAERCAEVGADQEYGFESWRELVVVCLSEGEEYEEYAVLMRRVAFFLSIGFKGGFVCGLGSL